MKLHNPHPWHKQRRVDGHPESVSSATTKHEAASTSSDVERYRDAAERRDSTTATVTEESFKERFGFTHAEGWSAAETDWNVTARGGLEHMWRILQTLPESHVTHDMLKSFKYEKFEPFQDLPGGTYRDDTKEIAIRYDDRMREDSPRYKGGRGTEEGDPLHEADRLDETVKHEVGHSLDALRKYSERFNPADWRDHTPTEMLDALVDGHGKGDEPFKDDFKTLLGTLVKHPKFTLDRDDEDHDDLPSALDELIDAALDEQTPEFTADDRARLAGALERLGLHDEANRKAALGDLIEEQEGLFDALDADDFRVGDRVYKHCAGEGWRSYDTADQARKVSSYQYKTPSEWFAEHYAAYYYSPATRDWLKDKGQELPDTVNGTNTGRPVNYTSSGDPTAPFTHHAS